MKIKVLAFGVAKDILDNPSISVVISGSSLFEFKIELEQQYPKLKELSSYMIAVNNEYATDETLIYEGDEIAIIPPVSGG